MVTVQDLIHKLEQGPVLNRMRVTLLCLAMLALWVGYNWFCFRNFNTLEAMDAAQVARNVAEGRGFSTQFIRPLSIHVLKEWNQARSATQDSDPARLDRPHPDLTNPPLYPVLLAGWMKIYPKIIPADPNHRLWLSEGRPGRDPNDFFIGLLNQFLFFGALALTFFLARRLFDATTAWLTMGLMLGCELMWRFSISGLPTMLLIVITLGLAWLLVLLESDSREPKPGFNRTLLLAASMGALVGLGALTRYAYGWIILPALIFIGLFLPQRRVALILVAIGAFAVVFVPWLVRNYSVSGLPFGLATYAPLEATYIFPNYRLERSLTTDFSINQLRPLLHKLISGMRQLFQDDVPRLGGSWAAPFFLVGLMLGFRNQALRRLRYFVVGTLLVFMVIQSLARTQASDDVKDVNGENLLILLFPLVLMFGVALFFVLLEQINFPHQFFRYLAMGLFALIMCLPLITSFLPPRVRPLAYPPYFPPAIRETAGFMKKHELMMSDMPWAVAWYGNRQCIWLTLNAQNDFFAVNDFLKPIRGLYLTPLTMDSRFLTEWVRAGEHSWGTFILESVLRNEIPSTFPLRKMPKGYLPEQLFLSDWNRWQRPSASDSGDAPPP